MKADEQARVRLARRLGGAVLYRDADGGLTVEDATGKTFRLPPHTTLQSVLARGYWLREYTGQTIEASAWEEALHPRDAQGRFAEKGDAGVARDARTKRRDSAPGPVVRNAKLADQFAQLKRRVTMSAIAHEASHANVSLASLADLPEGLRKGLRDEVHFREIAEGTEIHKIAVVATGKALAFGAQITVSDRSGRSVPVPMPSLMIGEYDPPSASMSVANHPSGRVMLLNTLDDPEGWMAHRDRAGSYSAVVAHDMLDAGASVEEAMHEAYRVTALHEVAHVVDQMYGEGVSAAFARFFKEHYIDKVGSEDAFRWLANNISKYACDNARDAFAEVMSIHWSGGVLPQRIAKWVNSLPIKTPPIQPNSRLTTGSRRSRST